MINNNNSIFNFYILKKKELKGKKNTIPGSYLSNKKTIISTGRGEIKKHWFGFLKTGKLNNCRIIFLC